MELKMAKDDKATAPAAGAQQAPKGQIRIDASKAEAAYSNFFTMHETAEEVMINFGLAQQWNPQQKELQVQMKQQVILHPNTARRLAGALVQMLEARDKRAQAAKK
jgi:hypothetical protein